MAKKHLQIERLQVWEASAVFIPHRPGKLLKAVCALCQHEYYKHENGCPWFGLRDICAPRAPLFPGRFELTVYVVAVRLDFKIFMAYRKKKHPDWSQRALENSRHWQNALNAERDRHLKQMLAKFPNNHVDITNPEAMGIDVTATCRQAGVYLEWPKPGSKCLGNIHYIHKVALIAKPI